MQLIFLHGPPAVGKLTVAQSLQERLSARLADNHASIDLARTVFEFGAPGFWKLVAKLRADLLEAAAASDLRYLITTACYVHPDDTAMLNGWQETLTRHGGALRPVFLTAPPDILRQRVGQLSREKRNKLTSVAGLDDHITRNSYVAVPIDDCITVDTSTLTADGAATQIIQRLGLDGAAA